MSRFGYAILVAAMVALAYSAAGHSDQLDELTDSQRAEVVARWDK